MSKERARRRAEREVAAAVATDRRRVEAERRTRAAARRTTWRTTWLGWLPARRSRPGGLLAERRRRQLTTTLALLVGANLLAVAFSPDWGLRAFVLVASLLGAPVVHTLLDRRT